MQASINKFNELREISAIGVAQLKALKTDSIMDPIETSRHLTFVAILPQDSNVQNSAWVYRTKALAEPIEPRNPSSLPS